MKTELNQQTKQAAHTPGPWIASYNGNDDTWIAAAPELLEALIECDRELTKLWRSLYATKEPDEGSALGKLLTQARHAIAKAKGQS